MRLSAAPTLKACRTPRPRRDQSKWSRRCSRPASGGVSHSLHPQVACKSHNGYLCQIPKCYSLRGTTKTGPHCLPIWIAADLARLRCNAFGRFCFPDVSQRALFVLLWRKIPLYLLIVSVIDPLPSEHGARLPGLGRPLARPKKRGADEMPLIVPTNPWPP
jgi:hypothetical protein